MKYLKTFELYNTGNQLDYDVGDIVKCTNKNFKTTGYKLLTFNKEYKVLKIYQIPEDKFLKNPYVRVYVQDVETGEILKGMRSDYFKHEIESDADKYNL